MKTANFYSIMGTENLSCQFGVLSRPDGSVQLSEGIYL